MAQKEKKKVDKQSEELLKEIEKVTDEKKDKKNKKKEPKKVEKKNKTEKKNNVVKNESWWHGVKSEFKKVRWPNRKEMVKYSIATISFIIFFGLFFFLIEGIILLIYKL